MQNALRPWLAYSFTMAVLAFGLGWIGIGAPFFSIMRGVPAAGLLSFVLSVVWFLIFATSLIILRWRALWLLIGAPFAFAWPGVIILFAMALADCAAQHSGTPGACLP